MRKRASRRHAARVVATLVTFSLGATLAVLVAGSASAAGSKGTTTTGSPATQFFVINGTVNAASDHEIVGSSAFPNFTTGAVDNYYAMAHAHVDNSPFAEGRASPADTGPVGQTAAAGNFQQPQYADARWPGDPPTATYGSQGGPYATAAAGEYNATADASEASNGLSGPGTTGAPTLAAPAGFDGRLQDALAAWKAKWQGTPAPATPTVTTPVPTVTLPRAATPSAKVTTPTPTVTTPVATVTTPTGTSPAPPVPVPTTSLPSAPRSLQSSAKPADGETLLTSSSLATLDAKTNTLVTSGESSVGRVSLGGGQIVIEGIHVTASIANDGTPEYKTAVSVAAATIGGVPVTIDEDGVHVAGQGQGLPTRQASDALNNALKQAGIRLFLVAPEVTKPCGQSGSSSGSGTTTTTTTNDQADSTSSCDQGGATGACGSSDSGGSNGPALPSVGPSSTTSTTSSDQSNTTTTSSSSCDQPTTTTSCDQPGTTTSGSSGGGLGGINTSPTTTSKNTSTTSTTTTTSGCDQAGTAPTTSSCSTAAASPTSTSKTDTTPAPSPTDPMGVGAGATNASEETVTATGVHVVFTQPVNQSGVPAQYVEHILGEVFVDSLAAPATAGTPPTLALSSFSASSSTCGGHSGKSTSSGLSSVGGSSGAAGGSLAAGGATASGVPSASGGTFASGSQPASGSGATGNALPAALAAALRKPLWLLLAYLVWQAIVVATGASLWNWRRGEAS